MNNQTMGRFLALGILSISVVLLVTSAVAIAAGPDDSRTINVLGHEVTRDRVSVPSDWGAPITKQIEVQAAFNGEDIVFRARFPADKPGIHHDYMVYEGGKWVRHGGSLVGSVPDRLYEDRFTFHVDDGAVRGFANYGCSVTCHSDLRHPFMYNAPESAEVKSNSYYNDVIKKSDTRKYIPESRRGDGEWWDVSWSDISAENAEFIAGLKEAGVFLDQWHWRAARGGPIGVSDDMWVLDYRNGDGGGSAYSTNSDSETGLPKFMFDPETTGTAAPSFDDVRNQRLTTDDIYFLGPDNMVDFDANRQWQEGDALPRRYNRAPKDSRGDITSKSNWADGWWTVELRRKMDTGHSDDKGQFRPSACDGRAHHLAKLNLTDFVNGDVFHPRGTTEPSAGAEGQSDIVIVIRLFLINHFPDKVAGRQIRTVEVPVLLGVLDG